MTEREQQANETLQDIAHYIKTKLPEGMGFTVLAYEFGSSDEERRLFYISNSNREDVMQAMVEFIQKNIENPKMYGKDV